MSILVIQHEDECPPARFGTWMTGSGATLDVRKPYAADTIPADLTAHSGLLVLGGAMNAIDEVATPWLVPTKALVREALSADVPLLGTSFVILLDAAMDSGGDVAHLETGRLDQLDAMPG